MMRLDPAELAAWNAANTRARLHARVWPISSSRRLPACVDECGRHVPATRVGERCAMCERAAETKGKL